MVRNFSERESKRKCRLPGAVRSCDEEQCPYALSYMISCTRTRLLLTRHSWAEYSCDSETAFLIRLELYIFSLVALRSQQLGTIQSDRSVLKCDFYTECHWCAAVVRRVVVTISLARGALWRSRAARRGTSQCHARYRSTRRTQPGALSSSTSATSRENFVVDFFFFPTRDSAADVVVTDGVSLDAASSPGRGFGEARRRAKTVVQPDCRRGQGRCLP